MVKSRELSNNKAIGNKGLAFLRPDIPLTLLTLTGEYMKITEFNLKLARIQKGGKGERVNIADTAEQTRTMRKLIKEDQGIDIYTIIRRMR